LLSAILVVCVAAPIQGAPKLLVEFTHKIADIEFGDPLPTTVPFDFDAGDPILLLTFVDWRQNYGSNDVGMTFIAPAAVIDGADRAIASPETYYLLETGPANFATPRTLAAPNCLPNDCGGTLVPVFDLPMYNVTAVERIIDQLVITRTQGEFYFLEAAQRIRFWGERIPEPGTKILLVTGIGYCALLRCAVCHRPTPQHKVEKPI
jgi:hypothetical protein